MVIDIDGTSVEVIVKRKKIKNTYFKWENNILIVTCPNFITNLEIKLLIKKNLKSLKKLKMRTPVSNLENDEIFFLGDKYKIIFTDTKIPEIVGNIIYVKDTCDLDKWLLKQCESVFSKRISILICQFPSLPNFTLKIRKMKTRWGVCNIKNMTVTLNFELIKKDISLIDYVIIHELCHFKYMNHSESFWNEVSKYYPYYKRARKMLRG